VLRRGSPRAAAPDYDIAGGHFFTQTNGRTDSRSGFAVTDADGVPFWSAFQALGGADVLTRERVVGVGRIVVVGQQEPVSYHAHEDHHP